MRKQKQKQRKKVDVRQRQSVVVNISKPRRSKAKAIRYIHAPTPLPPNYIYIHPPPAQAPLIIPRALPDTEHPPPLPLAPRVPIRVPTNLADTEHEIPPVSLGGVDRQAEMFQEAVAEAPVEPVEPPFDEKLQAASDLIRLAARARISGETRDQAASQLANIGELAKARGERRSQAASQLTGIGEIAKTRKDLGGLFEIVPPPSLLEPAPVEPGLLDEWGGSAPKASTTILVGKKLPPLPLGKLTEVEPPEPTGTLAFVGSGPKSARLLKAQTFEEAPKTQRPAFLPGETIQQAAARQAEETRAETVNELEKARKPKDPKEPDPDWYTPALKKEFRAINKLQREKDMENKADKAEADRRYKVREEAFKKRVDTSGFLDYPDRAAALKRGFAAVGGEAVKAEGGGFSFTS